MVVNRKASNYLPLAKTMQTTYKIDLTKIAGEGDFPCPKCGTLISPDDETEKVYTIIDTMIGEDEYPENVVIRCNRCNKTISLEGFAVISEEETSRIGISEALPQSKPGYKTEHALSMNGQSLGYLVVEYAQKEDVKAFKRFRKIKLGQPFKSIVTIENMDATGVKNQDFQDIARAMKRNFKGLKTGDIYILEINKGNKNIIGRF